MSPGDPGGATPAALPGRRAPRTGPGIYIDIGAAKTAVVLCAGGEVLRTRLVQSGGQQVTAALADRLGLDFATAESRKLAPCLRTAIASHAYRSINASALLEAAVRELATAIESQLDFISTIEPASLDRVVVTGGSAGLPEIRRHLARATGHKVVRGRPIASLDVEPDLTARVRELEPQLVTALAVASDPPAPARRRWWARLLGR